MAVLPANIETNAEADSRRPPGPSPERRLPALSQNRPLSNIAGRVFGVLSWSVPSSLLPPPFSLHGPPLFLTLVPPARAWCLHWVDFQWPSGRQDAGVAFPAGRAFGASRAGGGCNGTMTVGRSWHVGGGPDQPWNTVAGIGVIGSSSMRKHMGDRLCKRYFHLARRFRSSWRL